ncbi:hypothetical protein GDO81_015885 [Engystomops pustulosus]|uniref:Dysbindin domain-containing protein 1 n=1 Tax=Engystomops pustulosus TaxID=76066 RepID=A0AAV7ATV2_ENGPU|nr:hypothetical protein GDO81_015885 [Engystomops pustulosus]
MEPQQGPGPSEQTRQTESEVSSHPRAPAEVTVEEPQQPPVAEQESGVLAPTSGLLHVTERRQPLSSVSSLEVHFDLLDLTELTDMSDQELAEVFADSDDENPHHEPPPGVLCESPIFQGKQHANKCYLQIIFFCSPSHNP